MLKVAVPMVGGEFSTHFGGAEQFALVDVDEQSRSVRGVELASAPPHERGAFPVWLRGKGVTTVIAGGMGPRAVQIFEHYGMDVVLGVGAGDPRALALAYACGELRSTGSLCEGGGLHDCGHDHGDH